MLNIIRN